jgi:hypothetical protein
MKNCLKTVFAAICAIAYVSNSAADLAIRCELQFFVGIAQTCVRKELKLANCLDFFVSFFVKEKRKR